MKAPAHLIRGTLKKHRGASLIELLVGILLGLLITLAVTSSFIAQRTTMTTTAMLANNVDTLRTGGELIARALREHGFDPCTNGNYPDPTITTSGAPLKPSILQTVRAIPINYNLAAGHSDAQAISADQLRFSSNPNLLPNDTIVVCSTSRDTWAAPIKASVSTIAGNTVTISNANLSPLTGQPVAVARLLAEQWEIVEKTDARGQKEHAMMYCAAPYPCPPSGCDCTSTSRQAFELLRERELTLGYTKTGNTGLLQLGAKSDSGSAERRLAITVFHRNLNN